MSIQITTLNPFANGQTFTANLSNNPLIIVTYTSPTGDVYTSATANASLNITCQRYTVDVSDATPPGPTKTYARYTFSGNLRIDDPLNPLVVNIQNGLYAHLVTD
jgi:hypothetical protein